MTRRCDATAGPGRALYPTATHGAVNPAVGLRAGAAALLTASSPAPDPDMTRRTQLLQQ
jgi:hypothetical protein